MQLTAHDPPPVTAITPKVPARMSPAEVTVGPVWPIARMTASRRGSAAASSQILVMIRMWPSRWCPR